MPKSAHDLAALRRRCARTGIESENRLP
jgi:hypothetical protein